MGLSNDELMGMNFEQFNAYSYAHVERTGDQLSLLVQAAYLGAYWNGSSKTKKSLKSVLKSIRQNDMLTKSREAIDIAVLEERFRKVEEIRKYGYTKE